MRSTNLPGNLPMLPGNVYADPTVTRYHKTQLLGVKDGTICGKSLTPKTTNHQVFVSARLPITIGSRYKNAVVNLTC